VRGAIIDGIRSNSALPRRVFQRLRMMESAAAFSEHSAEDALGAAPPGETRADAQRMLDEHLASMATAMAAGLVSQSGVGEEGERLAVDPEQSPEDHVQTRQLLTLLSRQVDELPDDERELVRRHYFEGERFDHVARDLGLSKSWASRLHTRAIGRLTQRMRDL
jgi:RNA polymerase sigma factor for flagellar operon FliA